MKKIKIITVLTAIFFAFSITACSNSSDSSDNNTEEKTPAITNPETPATPEVPETPETPKVPENSGEGNEGGENGSNENEKPEVLVFTGTPYTEYDTKIINEKTYTLVKFGDWPQTIKEDSVSVDETKSVVVGMFTYYKGDDGAWYAKSLETQESYTLYSDGTEVSKTEANSSKYFKVEPIKWRILTTEYDDDGDPATAKKKLLLAEDALDRSIYDDDLNNYKDSYIRNWLNNDFLGTAFTEELQDTICTTEVNNSVRSTSPSTTIWDNGENNHVCDNTKDKIFLLSEEEVTQSAYGFEAYDVNDTVRIHYYVDFALARGGHQDFKGIWGTYWWLRSPMADSGGKDYSKLARMVAGSGAAWCNSDVSLTSRSAVPALCVN